MGSFYLIGIVLVILSFWIQRKLKNKFKKYSQISNALGLTGKQIAEKMLMEHGLNDVQVISVKGSLSDHYNPAKKTVNLSPDVYSGNHIAAAAVAAHECGHAVQHAEAYRFLTIRSALVPITSFTSKYSMFAIIGGVFLLNLFPGFLFIGIIMYALGTFFSFVTLPVEFDASRRALLWLNKTGMHQHEQYDKAKDALKWAAMTYVVAALASLAYLLHFVGIYGGRD